MRLTLIDRILDLQPGHRIRAAKCLTLTEEYLKDHFPRFPVMPGVMMLEVMYQTAAWLVRVSDDFAHSLVTLAEANNVKFSDFVEPGDTLIVTAELLKQDPRYSRLQCEGEVGGSIAVRGRLVLERSRLDSQDPRDEPLDAYIIHELREKYQLLYPARIAATTAQDTSG